MSRPTLKWFLFLSLVSLNGPLAQESRKPPTLRIAKPGEKVAVVGNITFVTNRNAIAVGKQTKESATAFLDVPTRELKYGYAHFKLDGKVHELGKLDEAITLSKRQRSTEALTLARDTNEVVVYIHGYNNGFDDAVRQGVLLRHDLALTMSLIVFSWASNGTPVGYHLDRWDIEKNADALAEFMAKLAKSRPKGSVNFIVHSMGNDVFLNAIQRLDEQGELKNLRFGKVVLAAPDVAPDFFRSTATKAVQHSDRVVHYFSTEDWPIFFSRYVNFTQGVRAGAKVVEIPGLEVIDVDQVNTPKVRGGHGYFAAVSEILSDISQVLTDDTAKKSVTDRQKEKVEEVRTPSGFSYFRFK